MGFSGSDIKELLIVCNVRNTMLTLTVVYPDGVYMIFLIMMKLTIDDPLKKNDCDAEANDAESVTSMVAK